MSPLYAACVAAMFLTACDDGMSPTSGAEADSPVRVGFLSLGPSDLSPNGAMIAGGRSERPRGPVGAYRGTHRAGGAGGSGGCVGGCGGHDRQ